MFRGNKSSRGYVPPEQIRYDTGRNWEGGATPDNVHGGADVLSDSISMELLDGVRSDVMFYVNGQQVKCLLVLCQYWLFQLVSVNPMSSTFRH